MNVVPPEVLLAPRDEVDPSVAQEAMSGTVDQGIQTMFRESEAQTDPFTPEVTIDASKPTPEVSLSCQFYCDLHSPSFWVART